MCLVFAMVFVRSLSIEHIELLLSLFSLSGRDDRLPENLSRWEGEKEYVVRKNREQDEYK